MLNSSIDSSEQVSKFDLPTYSSKKMKNSQTFLQMLKIGQKTTIVDERKTVGLINQQQVC